MATSYDKLVAAIARELVPYVEAALRDSEGRILEHLADVQRERDEARVLTGEEVAEMLRCTRDTVYRRAPELGGRKVGSEWRFPYAAVRPYVDGERP